MTDAPFSILDQLMDSDAPRLTSPEELRALCSELELHGAYQILAWRHKADHGGMIEIEITWAAPK